TSVHMISWSNLFQSLNIFVIVLEKKLFVNYTHEHLQRRGDLGRRGSTSPLCNDRGQGAWSRDVNQKDRMFGLVKPPEIGLSDLKNTSKGFGSHKVEDVVVKFKDLQSDLEVGSSVVTLMDEAATWRRLTANKLYPRYCAGGGLMNGRMARHHRGSHETFQCQQMNQNTDSSGFDQIQTPHNNEEHSVQYKKYLENPSNEIATLNSNQEKEKLSRDSDIRQLIREECCIKACRKQKQNIEDTMLELIEICHQKEFYCMHNDVDDLIESALNSKLFSINLESQRLDKKKQKVKNIVEKATKRGTLHAITPILPTKEPEYSLSMGYEHLSTISETKSDEVIESSAKNLLPIPSEYEVTSDDENECDVPVKDESSLVFTKFTNPIFGCNGNFTSSDDESISDEDVPIEDFKVYSNPLFDDEEINSDKLDPHCFNAESDFVESLSNHDTLIDSSLKFDFLEEFSGELLPTSIADEKRIRREHAEYISLMERLFTINLCPRLMKKSNTIIKTLPTSRIPLEDSDSLREEIDIFTGTDDLLPPDIESDDYDLEGDIHVLEELLGNDTPPIPEDESSNFDHHDNPSFPRPPSEPPDVEIFFKPDLGVLTPNVVKGIFEHYVLMPNILPTLPTFDPFYPVYDTLLPFLSENKDKVFKPGILSYLLVSLRTKPLLIFLRTR
nr:hypothetical protein [Tanacetum cinerariifolium]